MAERILMNEYKALAQEKWVNVEVRWPLFSQLLMNIVLTDALYVVVK